MARADLDFDRAYRDRVYAAVLDATFRTAMNADNQVILRSAELVEVFCLMIAAVSSTSARCDTPQGVRLFSEECAKAIARNVRLFKDSGGESVFDAVIRDDRTLS